MFKIAFAAGVLTGFWIGAAPAAAPSSLSPAGQIEIVLAGGDRIIVDRTVDAVALARVIKILSRR